MKRSAKFAWLKRIIAKEENPEVQAMLWYQLLDLKREAEE